MRKSIGIPRGLLVYHYLPLWQEFFRELGLEIVLSRKTSKDLLNNGIRNAVDEACLPVKVYYGHVMDLVGRVDYIFCPRLVSLQPKTYVCPKFLGLPDMIRNNVRDLPGFIDNTFNLHESPGKLWPTLYQVGKQFSANPWRIYQAYRKALVEQKNFEIRLTMGELPHEILWGTPRQNTSRDKAVAIIGHPYNIYDEFISMNLLKRLKEMGMQIFTPEGVSPATVEYEAGKLPKKLFWNMGRQLVGAAFHYMDHPQVVGMIHVAAFGCGPDSFTSEFIERKARRKGLPYLNLTIDEHSGEAGIVTRLEAFLDMINWREQRSESNLPTHG